MFAVVANGIQCICKTQQKLDYILAVYPYPKFRKCRDEAEAKEWIRRNQRSINKIEFQNYGETATTGYATVEYFIANDNIYYNIYTKHVGFIKVQSAPDTKVDCRQDLVKVKICNVKLDPKSINHNVIAVKRILTLLGEYIDVNIVVPDISIYLALTKYTGRNYILRGTQNDIRQRLGGVSITIKE